MKILIICDALNRGGAGRVATIWANSLSDRGHTVSFLTNLHKEVNYELSGDIELCNFLSCSPNGFMKLLKAILSVRQHVKRINPDVIIGVQWLCSIIGWLASIGKRIPVIATDHSSYERPQDSPMPLKNWFAKFYLNKLYKCVTVLTAADAKVIANRLKHVEVMPNPLYLKPNYANVDKKKIILACGRIYDWHCKGFDILIQAWGLISIKYPDWKLQILGEGDSNSLAILKSLILENNVENSTLIISTHTDVLPYYKEAEIFVLSSRYEGFGLVLIEAMSQQCACIACDNKGRQSEIIDDKINGLLCECGSPEALAQAISYLIGNDKIRKIMQKEAVLKSESFAPTIIADRWEDLLKRIVN